MQVRKHAEESCCVQGEASWTVGKGRGEVDQVGDRLQEEIQYNIHVSTSIRRFLPVANQAR
jgi:hypothetical protein